MADIDTDKLDKIVKETIAAVEQGKSKIYDIYEAGRNEMDSAQRDVDRVKQEAIDVIFRVDELERWERHSRIRLMEVSRNFQVYNEEDIRLAYEAANNLQIELAVAREQEQNLRQRRNELEIRLQKLKATVTKAEELVSQVGLALGYLENKMGSVLTSLETLQQRQIFGSKIIKAQEEERRRVAREIHDGPAQSMANVVFRAEVCERLADIDIPRCKTELSSLREQVRGCLKETRIIIFDLRPMTLDDLGLVPTIRRVLKSLQERIKIHAEINVLGGEKRVEPYVEIGVFRIVQEALNNVEKHAKAMRVRVLIEFRSHAVHAVIEDDGVGFDSSRKVGNDSFGLMGIKERIHLLDGEFNIKSQTGRGVKIAIKVPLP